MQAIRAFTPQVATVATPQKLSAAQATGNGLANTVLDAVRAVTDFLDTHPNTGAAVVNTFALMKAVRAFPKFIYPTITGATAQEKSFILNV
ncbi:MAG: hypothetical protein FJX76_17605, partial [Armatimonadetes bacterium]|nr:hypothetical protein [Armatimonadota bacterium]